MPVKLDTVRTARRIDIARQHRTGHCEDSTQNWDTLKYQQCGRTGYCVNISTRTDIVKYQQCRTGYIANITARRIDYCKDKARRTDIARPRRTDTVNIST
ncbi:hypothetical protein AVEN_71209-1 [Araneus ventricosus]|uniref:Uncharacterized protein n=1 Tax=Araneus ventricosus TaxID=182803 RepID=A0A4Y2UZZ5_ARAVE|nr:hypothetical protein AVEN_71209-1 [Araneus ventricosus]